MSAVLNEIETLPIAEAIDNPFPGLRAFRYEESHLYFGREGQIDDVLKKLIKNRFVAIVGTSGIGKSSFIYCGLFPLLYGDYKTDFSDSWEIFTCRPGVSPIRNLANSLVDMKGVREGDKEVNQNLTYATLCESSSGLVETIRPLYENNKKNYLVFVDQFEEIFRFKNSAAEANDEAAAFLKLIIQAIEEPNIPIYVVLTMRSDFVGDCSQYPNLTKVINESQFLIPHMTRNEKKAAISGPVSIMNGSISDRLVQQLLNDVGDSPDQLPIMQHALMRTWDYWQKNKIGSEPLSLNHYEAIGGMKRALSMHANEAFNELTEEQKKICEKLFKTITEKGEEGRGVRRPTKLKDIASIANAPMEDVIKVVDHFRMPGRTLLMPPYNVQLNENSIIDISHESLMRIWVSLQKWVEEEAESVKVYLRLAEAAEMHQLGKAGLWRPPDLDIALKWREDNKPSMLWGLRYHPAYERTMQFLEFSEKEYEKEQIIKEKLQKRRLIAARIISVIFGFGGLVALMFFLYAQQQSVKAEKATKKATYNALKADSAAAYAKLQADFAKAQGDSARLSAERAEDAKNEALKEKTAADYAKIVAQRQTEKAIASKAEAELNRRLANIEKDNAYNLRLLSIARSMAIKSVQIDDPVKKSLVAHQAYLFNAENKGKKNDPDIYDAMYYSAKSMAEESFNNLKGHTQNVRVIASIPGSRYLYSAGSDGKIFRWDSKNLQGEKLLIADNPNLVVKSMAVSKDQKYLVCGGNSSNIYLYDLTKPSPVATVLKGNTGEIWYLEFLPDNKRFISSGSDKRILEWDLTKSTEISQSDLKVNTMCLHPEGGAISVGKSQGVILLINRSDNSSRVLYSDPDKVDIISLAYSRDGRFLAAGNERGTIRIFDALSGNLLYVLSGHTARVNNLKFSPDGKQLASGSFDRTVRIWNVKNFFDQPIVLKDHDDWVWSIEYTIDGEKILAGCKDNLIRIWPTTIEAMADKICGKLKRNFTNEEWELYVADDIPYVKTCKSLPVGEGVKK
ncbi:MAG: hypothetical protein ACK4ND_16130 [Cytophagaceae bacterium]